MTPKEKAGELVKKYVQFRKDGRLMFFGIELSKQCALIAVEELIKEQTMWQNGQENPVLYWQEVKQEIENL